MKFYSTLMFFAAFILMINLGFAHRHSSEGRMSFASEGQRGNDERHEHRHSSEGRMSFASEGQRGNDEHREHRHRCLEEVRSVCSGFEPLHHDGERPQPSDECKKATRTVCSGCFHANATRPDFRCLGKCVKDNAKKLHSMGCKLPPPHPSLPPHRHDGRKPEPSVECKKATKEVCENCFHANATRPDFKCIKKCLSDKKKRQEIESKGCKLPEKRDDFESHHHRRRRSRRRLLSSLPATHVQCVNERMDQFSSPCQSLFMEEDHHHHQFGSNKHFETGVLLGAGVVGFLALVVATIIRRRRQNASNNPIQAALLVKNAKIVKAEELVVEQV